MKQVDERLANIRDRAEALGVVGMELVNPVSDDVYGSINTTLDVIEGLDLDKIADNGKEEKKT